MPAKRQGRRAKSAWYLAHVIMQITVAGDRRSVVHVNMVLVRARSDDDAYEAAVKLGRDGEFDTENEQGDAVRTRFRGLRDLYAIHEDTLEHGTELIYSEDIGLPEAAIKKMVIGRDRLTVFAHVPGRVPGGPDYMSADIAKMLRDAGFDPKAERPPEPRTRGGAAAGRKPRPPEA